jgi:NADPH-dependent curcumin reductase CurA
LLLEQSVAFRKNGMIYGEYFYKILEMVQKEMGTYIYDRQLNHKQNIATEGLLDVPFILPVLKPEFR